MQIILEVPDRLGEQLQQLGDRLPEAILAIRPTPALQTRMSELLDRHKSGTLSRSEEVELDRYLLLEHWVRSAKAHAYKYLQVTA